jgi:hypothetical protein
MTRSRQRRAIPLVLLAIFPIEYSIPGLMGPSVPEFKRPSEAEIEQTSQRKMGKALKRDIPITTDGPQVVFQTGHANGIRIVPSVQIEIIDHKSRIVAMDRSLAP